MKMTDELKWNLQLFADDDGADGAEGSASGGDPDPAGKEGAEGGTEKKPDDGDEKKYSDADVDKIVEKKFAKWKAKHEEDLETAKKEAVKLAKMNADQKKDYELEKIKAENESLKADAAKIELGKEAAKILKESKIDATQDILDLVVGSDADSTKANIDKFVGIIKAQIAAAEVERAKGKTPKSYGNGGKDDRTEIQRRVEKYRK